MVFQSAVRKTERSRTKDQVKGAGEGLLGELRQTGRMQIETENKELVLHLCGDSQLEK